MATFKTADGREWTIAVNVATVKRTRELTGVNLLALVGEQAAISELFSDDVRLCEVLCAVIRPQLEAASVSDDQFFATINGDVIERAAEALLNEIVDFFQEPRRGLMKKALAKYKMAIATIQAANAKAAEKAIEEMDAEAAIAQTLTSSVSSSPVAAA